MIPSITAARLTGARHRTELPLLVLGPSLGASATTLWSSCATGLADSFDLLAWDLPGHGHNRVVPDEPFTGAELAEGVLRVVDDVLDQRGDTGGRFFYAGDAAGGIVGLQLILDRPDRIAAAALLCTGAAGAPHAVDDTSHAHVRAAIASVDVRERLAEIAVPVLAVAGSSGLAAPPALVRAVADGVRDGTYAELEGVGDRAPDEAPDAVAALLRSHFLGEEPVRDTDLARDLQELVAAHARGGDGDRPGLDRRSRSLVTLAALVARGRDEELAAHARAARADGLGVGEIEEAVRQTAVACGVPATAAAVGIVTVALADDGS